MEGACVMHVTEVRLKEDISRATQQVQVTITDNNLVYIIDYVDLLIKITKECNIYSHHIGIYSVCIL